VSLEPTENIPIARVDLQKLVKIEHRVWRNGVDFKGDINTQFLNKRQLWVLVEKSQIAILYDKISSIV
jgi:hypothetical protein